MSVATSGGRGWGALLRTWRELDVPEGWRAEVLAEGRVVMSPSPGTAHNQIVARVARQLGNAMPEAWDALPECGVSIARLHRIYQPDLAVVPASRLDEWGESAPVPAELALLVVEVVSRDNARHDRVEKLWAYAAAPVPVYLLVDRYAEKRPSVTVYSDPIDGAYRQAVTVPFGRSAWLPEPIGLEIDTSGFPT